MLSMSSESIKLVAEEKRESKISIEELYKQLKTGPDGISKSQATKRLKEYGYNQAVNEKELNIIFRFLSKFANPLTITLICVGLLSFFLGQQIDAIIVIMMAILSVTLSFIQEYSASRTAKKLNELINVSAIVIRDGKKIEIPIKEIVPGDIIELSAGKMVPADVRIISSSIFSVNQSVLNGESFPVEKKEEPASKSLTSVFDTENLAFMGSSVAGGSALAIVLFTGKNTEFGKLSLSLTSTKKEASSFDKGIKDFTYLMIKLIVVLAVVIFISNVLLKGNPLEAILFSLAVAIGLTPEMLPMVITINLSKGATNMAKKKVIVKELASIQNFGAMDILCTDKTGTLTLDEVALFDYEDPRGKRDEAVFKTAYTNSYFQSGMDNILDKAVTDYKELDMSHLKKVGEIPFDFNRRIMSVIVKGQGHKIVSKGAPEEILKKSTHYQEGDKVIKISYSDRVSFLAEYDRLSQDGFRVLGVAFKDVAEKTSYSSVDESDLIFSGFISFLDPPKPSSKSAIDKLEALGIKIKILTGDNELVTRKVCDELSFKIEGILSGADVDKLDDDELRHVVDKVNIFTRLTPDNKSRIIGALRQVGHTVGFIGDGINDAPSIKAADVGISVNNASDIAKETAQIILLEKDLTILADCVIEGRKTFENSIKYIKMGASSNFGNMFSMAAASFFLPFLPMLPTQILLNNFLYDLSQVALPTDSVDQEYVEKPRPWNIKFLKKFILFIGPISSIFDLLTFGVMIFIFHASPSLFQTGWFVESLTTQILVIYIIRTNKIPFIESRPSRVLVLSTLSIVMVGMILPFTFLGTYFNFTPLPPLFFGILILMSAVYLLMVQFIKNLFLRRYSEL